LVTTCGSGTMSSPGSVMRRSSGVDPYVWPRYISLSSATVAAPSKPAPAPTALLLFKISPLGPVVHRVKVYPETTALRYANWPGWPLPDDPTSWFGPLKTGDGGICCGAPPAACRATASSLALTPSGPAVT
jgi:hypothetical protein